MMETQTPTRRNLETALIEKCWKDPEFKKQVVCDPKGMLERHLGHKLPSDVKIFVHEEDPKTLHFSIPAPPGNLAELSDEELEQVAGGTDIALSLIFGVVTAGVTIGAGGAAASLAAAGIDPW